MTGDNPAGHPDEERSGNKRPCDGQRGEPRFISRRQPEKARHDAENDREARKDDRGKPEYRDPRSPFDAVYFTSSHGAQDLSKHVLDLSTREGAKQNADHQRHQGRLDRLFLDVAFD